MDNNLHKCPSCTDQDMTFYKKISSNISNIPLGLDRPKKVEIDLLICTKCKIYQSIQLSDKRSIHEMYSEDSLSFENSLSKISYTDLTTTCNELSLINTKPPCK